MGLFILPAAFLLGQLIARIAIFFIRSAIYLVVYSPQLITSYMLCNKFLSHQDSVKNWIAIFLLIAILFYLATVFLKQFTITIKNAGSLLWIPFFILLFFYTCVLPAWLLYPCVTRLINLVAHNHAVPLSYGACTLIILYIYSRYHFFVSFNT